jgi:hypothetical protein
MIVKALVIEQLEADGTLRTFKFHPDGDRDLVVAVADEYDEPREGPFHFLDDEYATAFSQGFAECKRRRVGTKHLSRKNDAFLFNTGWEGIPTKRQEVSYYALSLPQFAILTDLKITDPRQPAREFKRSVTRDDQRHRYVIYIECSSSFGRFDFVLFSSFIIDAMRFPESIYADAKSDGTPHSQGLRFYQSMLPRKETEKVNNFFINNAYDVRQVGVLAPQATFQDVGVEQIQNENPSGDAPSKETDHTLALYARSLERFFDTETNNAKGIQMGDNIYSNQAGIVAPHGTFQGEVKITQVQTDKPEDQLILLANQLAEIRKRAEVTDPRQYEDLAHLLEAEKAAKAKDAAGTKNHLKQVGKWVLDFASSIGAKIAAEAIKAAIGL